MLGGYQQTSCPPYADISYGYYASDPEAFIFTLRDDEAEVYPTKKADSAKKCSSYAHTMHQWGALNFYESGPCLGQYTVNHFAYRNTLTPKEFHGDASGNGGITFEVTLLETFAVTFQ